MSENTNERRKREKEGAPRRLAPWDVDETSGSIRPFFGPLQELSSRRMLRSNSPAVGILLLVGHLEFELEQRS